MYRFVLSLRWLGGALLAVLLAAVMAWLGLWQLSRYHQRHTINERIDASATAAPAPLAEVLPAPGGPAGSVGPAPPAAAEWTRVSATGRYDDTHQILARGRTVTGQVGFEIVTPLVLADGSAVLVDRGWLPVPPAGDAEALPDVPAPPSGTVTVTGRVHFSESHPGPLQHRGGFIDVRRLSVPQLAHQLPYPIYRAYLLDSPAAGGPLTAVPIDHVNDWQNAAYVVQWWLMAVMTLIGYLWAVRREARDGGRDPDGLPAPRRPVPSVAAE